MLDPDLEETQPDLLGVLVRGLERRHWLDDDLARRELDREISEVSALVARTDAPPMRTEEIANPPRRVAVAMGLALVSAPHFDITLPPTRNGTWDPGDLSRRRLQPTPAISSEACERALALGGWELDELRDEVDRRVGTVLKQVRTVNWLWSHFGLPDPAGAQTLARVLVPGLPEGPIELVWRAGQLYVVADVEPFPSASLFLPWLRPPLAHGPNTFESRGVDPGLRARLGRGIGADDVEVGELLDRIVTLVPRRGAAGMLHHDHWRSYGFAGIADLGYDYTRGAALAEPEPVDGFEWRVWLLVEPGQPLRARYSPERLFDALAIPRVGALLRQLHVAILAAADRRMARPDRVHVGDEVDLYDVPFHLRRVLDPLLHWIDRPATHLFLARNTGRDVEEVSALLGRLAAGWRAHAALRWTAHPGTRVPSVQTLLVQHLVVLQHSLLRTLTAPEDPRGPHADLALLFAAHYLREASLERTLFRTPTAADDDEAPEEAPVTISPPEDPVGHWFWPLWRRLLEVAEPESHPTPAG